MQKKLVSFRSAARLAAKLVLAVGLCALAPLADAHVSQITINAVESPTYAGAIFGAVGTYTRIEGTFTGCRRPTQMGTT
jgi:hypothetical protein